MSDLSASPPYSLRTPPRPWRRVDALARTAFQGRAKRPLPRVELTVRQLPFAGVIGDCFVAHSRNIVDLPHRQRHKCRYGGQTECGLLVPRHSLGRVKRQFQWQPDQPFAGRHNTHQGQLGQAAFCCIESITIALSRRVSGHPLNRERQSGVQILLLDNGDG